MDTSKTKADWFFWGSILIGLFVMIVGIFSLIKREIGIAEARLILCSGLGILFGTLGSTAVVKYKGITITGVASISIVLLYVVVTLTSSQATFGSITGDIKGAQIDIKGDRVYLGAIRDRSYDFVVPDNELKRPAFDVYFYYPPNERGEGEQEINLEGIDKKYIERVLGSGRRIEWRFNREWQTLVETETGKTISRNKLPAEKISVTSNNSKGACFFIGKALAKQGIRSVEDMLVDLGSGVASVRRSARDELASLEPTAANVTMMMKKLKKSGSLYRIRLGIILAFAKMLRKDKELAQEISSLLSFDDLEIIVKALNDNDRTIRINAGEFLRDLGDPRVIEPVLSLADDSIIDSEAIFLSSLVIKGTYHRLSIEEKQETDKKLQEFIKSLNPLNSFLVASPNVVSPGQKSKIIVTVRDLQNQGVPGAEVSVYAGGGRFLPSSDQSYDPKSRLHGAYSATGVTNLQGEFTTWWVCNPCAREYRLSSNVSKEGYIDKKSEFIILIH